MIRHDEFGAFTTTGSSSNTGITAGLTFDRQGIAWRHRLTARVDYLRANGTTTREQFLTRYERNYQVSDNFYVYASRRLSATGSKGFQAAMPFQTGWAVRCSRRMTYSSQSRPNRHTALPNSLMGVMKVGLQGW